ncbi:MAG: hypothetical protein M3O09_17570 [Acidobacteriota bacterium]|nr:hypothetical protein [Acidobacteriota bacterium]
MKPARVDNFDLVAPPVAQTVQQRALVVGVIFGLVAAVFAFISPDQFFHSYLVGFMLWLGATLGCMAFLMLQHLTGGAWGKVIRRMLEAGTRTLPLMAVLFIPLIFGMKHLYVWMNPQEVAKSPHLQDLTRSYLSPAGYMGRAALYFAIWGVLIFFLNRLSADQDNPPARDLSPRFRVISGPGLVLYAFTISFAVIDWVMSLDPHWISTIYPLIFIIGECLTALCMMVVVETILFPYKPMSVLLRPKEVHDHGKLTLALVMLWAYFSFSQFLIIWAGNLPEEIPFYRIRLYNGWQYVALFIVLGHFVLPFLFLLSRPFKRNPKTLVKLSVWLIFMRLVDLYWYIEPNFHKDLHFSALDIVVPVAIGGFWLALFFRNLKQRPLLPLQDPKAWPLLEPAHD